MNKIKTPDRTPAEAKVFDGLNEFIDFLEKKGELTRVTKPVSSKFEVAAIQMKILNEIGKPVLFTNVDGKAQRMLGNIYTSRKMLGYMFNEEPDRLVERVLSFKHAPRFPVTFVDTAPCQAVVHDGFKDIKDIVPIPWNYEKDASRYITAGIVTTKDPETGKINTAICRMMYKGGQLLSIFFAPMQHNWLIFNKYRALKENMPIAVIVGADPMMMFASESGIPYEENEFEYAGAMKGRSIEVIKCKAVDHYVPAHAEYILEGFVSWDQKMMEGPMGENQRVYGKQAENPVATISCITHNEDPIYQNILPGTVEEHSLLAVPMEARILEKLRTVSEHVITINLLPNFMNCVIKIDDYPLVQRGVCKNILLSALSEPWIKYAVIVNKDVNIEDANEVNWAISTRAHLSEDLLLIKDVWGFVMDPSRQSQEEPVTKLGIDATFDPAQKERFLKADVSGYGEVDLDDYVGT